MRLGVATMVCLSLMGVAIATPASASITKYTNIPTEDLGSALQALAQEYDVQVVYLSDGVDKLRTAGAVGDLTADEALKKLLKGTGLAFRYLDDKTITVLPEGGAASLPARDLRSSTAAPRSNSLMEPSNDDASQSSKDDLWNRFRVAQLDQGTQGAASVGPQSSSTSAEKDSRLAEIIVTAQKKTERLQDVPMSITVLDPQALAENGQNSLLDYFDSVPGLNVVANSGGGLPGTDYITIRGLSAGYAQNPIVATLIDDVPVASSLQRGYGGLTSPDLDPSDLARIEVLKGPQGTLYGADSLGGLLKYVTSDPSVQSLSGRVQVTGVDIPGGGLGYAVRGAVNIPVSDTLAFRVSGFDRRDPGYIDDLTTGQNNFNTTDVYGGHLAALWRPSDNFSVKLSALVQQTQGETSTFDSNNSGQSTYSDLNLHSLPGTTAYTTQDQLYIATVNWKVAGLDIVSVTGYVVNTVRTLADQTAGFGYLAYFCQTYPNPFLSSGLPNPYYCGNSLPPGANPNAYDGAVFLAHVSTHKPTQELRIGSSIGRWLDWRLGGFYTHEEGLPTAYGFNAANPVTGAIGSPLYFGSDPTQTFQEYAVFGDATVHITNRFDIEFGGRESWNRQADQFLDVGTTVYDFDRVVSPELGTFHEYSGSAFTYQVAPRLKLTPDLMLYARIASGYRIGGYNVVSGIPEDGAIPPGYAPDKTTNYELGIKSDLLDRRLSIDAAVYYIDWRNFQTGVAKTIYLAGGNATEDADYTVNAGNAKSEGAELSLEVRPLEGLKITAQGSYDDAVLTQDLPAASTIYGVKGTQLPYSMRFSGGFTANQDIRLTTNWVGFVGGGFNYVGSRPYEFVGAPGPGQAPSPRTFFPAYRTLNLLAGARYDTLRVNLYANNVNNARGILSFGGANSVGNIYENNSSVIQPRTVGVSLSQSF
jgi:iron complex outermembrane receptor protein